MCLRSQRKSSRESTSSLLGKTWTRVAGKIPINAMFYAAEAAIVAIADRAGIETKQRHWLKAEAATELHERGVLDEDCGPLLRQLNQARKDVWY